MAIKAEIVFSMSSYYHKFESKVCMSSMHAPIFLNNYKLRLAFHPLH